MLDVLSILQGISHRKCLNLNQSFLRVHFLTSTVFFRRLLTYTFADDAFINPFKAFDYFFWIPWIMPHIGGLFGAIVYLLMVEFHHGEDEV